MRLRGTVQRDVDPGVEQGLKFGRVSVSISLSSDFLLGMTGRRLRPTGSGWTRFPVASGAVQQALGPDNDRPVDEPVAEPYDAETGALRFPGRGDDPLGGRHLLAGRPAQRMTRGPAWWKWMVPLSVT